MPDRDREHLQRACAPETDMIEAALTDDGETAAEPEGSLTGRYRRIVRAVRTQGAAGTAPDNVLRNLLEHQRSLAPPAEEAWSPSARFTPTSARGPLSAALAIALALVTSGLPTLLSPPPQTFTWMARSTEIPSTVTLSGGFQAAAPEFSAHPRADELDTTMVVDDRSPFSSP